MFRERTPPKKAMVASPRAPGAGSSPGLAAISEISPSAPVPARKPSRVRVQAGDRCVVPAKSKPRRRLAVTEAEDHSSLSMDSILWSDKEYSVSELASLRSRECPLIVKITRGYKGELAEDLVVDQVLQIHDCSHQKRVLAIDPEAKTISIPASYALEVMYVGTQRQSTPSTFDDVVHTARMPVHVHVVATGDATDAGPNADMVGETIELRSVTDDVFLRANHIIDGWIDQTRGVVITSFLGVEMVVAVGMRGATGEEWLDYRNMFSRSVRHLNFNLLKGYSEIVILPEDSEVGEIRTSQLQNEATSPHQCISNLLYSGSDCTVDVIASYTTDGSTDTGIEKELEYFNALPTTNSGDRSRDVIDVTLTPISPRSDTPFSEIDEEDIGEMFASVIKEAEESELRAATQQRERPMSAEPESPPSPDVGAGFQSRNNSIRNLLHNFETSTSTSTGVENRAQEYSLQRAARSHGTHPPRAIVVPQQQQQHQREAVTMETSFTRAPKRHDATTAVVVGAVIEPSLPSTLPSKCGGSGGKLLCAFQTIEDIPDDLTELSVNDVGQCLRLLNLENHVESFRQRQVDGALLGDLSEKALQNEFKLTPFNASKLTRFVRGWRPRM